MSGRPLKSLKRSLKQYSNKGMFLPAIPAAPDTGREHRFQNPAFSHGLTLLPVLHHDAGTQMLAQYYPSEF
jgi:hypothetical protein